jgi:hypothetical protein
MHAALKSAYTNTGKEVPDGVWKIERIAELPAIIEAVNTDDGRRKTEDRQSVLRPLSSVF